MPRIVILSRRIPQSGRRTVEGSRPGYPEFRHQGLPDTQNDNQLFRESVVEDQNARVSSHFLIFGSYWHSFRL